MKPYRKERIASVIHQVVGEILAFQLNDPRVVPFTVITRVEMSGDVQIATIYLKVPGSDADERRMMAAVVHAQGFIQKAVAHALSVRQCPKVRFEIDRAQKIADATMELLRQNELESAARSGARGEACEQEVGDGELGDLPAEEAEFRETGE